MEKSVRKRITAASLAVAMLSSMTLSASAAEEGLALPENYLDKKVVGYFPGYAIELEQHINFDITQLQWDKLTHIQYAFGMIDGETMELVPGEPETDTVSTFEDREFTHKGQTIEMNDDLGYYGQYNLMHTMMELYPDVTVLLSIGGWVGSGNFWLLTDSEDNMRTFAASAVEFMQTYGFHGIDLDFEYPSSTVGSGDPLTLPLAEERREGISDRYTELVRILREEFDKASVTDDTYYWLTAAVANSNWVNSGIINTDWLEYLDFVSVMSYDMGGGWTSKVENQANIHNDPANTDDPHSLAFEWGMNYYRGKVQAEKILMGVPYYTRGWQNVTGGDKGLHGVSSKPDVGGSDPLTGDLNIWHDKDEDGNEVAAGVNPLWHVLNVMQDDPGYELVRDEVGGVPYIWNEEKQQFITFENEWSVQNRIDYVEENDLGGVLIWVMHGDFAYDEEAEEYVVGDTLTTMFYDQLTALAPGKVTTDYDLDAPTADFDVKLNKAGSWEISSVDVTNNTGADLTGYTFSFDLPKSGYVPSWDTPVVTDSEVDGFYTVSFTDEEAVWANGETKTFSATIVYTYSDLKNFKLNGMLSEKELEDELARLERMSLIGGAAEEVTEAPETTETTETPETAEAETDNPKTGMEAPLVLGVLGLACVGIIASIRKKAE